jgi:radical SAM superfamily enzyme YgiQ (UPF0313 family)
MCGDYGRMKKILYFIGINTTKHSDEGWVTSTYFGADVLISHIDKTKYDVDYYDFNAIAVQKEQLEITEEFVEENYSFSGYDYILCSLPDSSLTHEFKILSTAKILKHLKKLNPNAKIIVGGVGWTGSNYTEEDYDRLGITDYVDVIFYNWLDPTKINELIEYKFVGKKVLEVSPFHHPGTILWNKDLELSMINIDHQKYSYDFIFKACDLEIPDKNYKDNYIMQAGMKFSDGCKNRCAFCAWAGMGQKPFRILPWDKIQDLFKIHLDKGYNSFYSSNNAINSSRRFADKFCNWVIRENLKFTWTDSACLDNNDKDMFKMFYESGCRVLYFGVETIDNNMQKYMGKNLTDKIIKDTIINSHEAGIWNEVALIIGFPYETPEMIENQKNFIIDFQEYINWYTIQVYRLQHGQPFYHRPKKYGLVVFPQMKKRFLEPIVDWGIWSNRKEVFFTEKDGRKDTRKYRREIRDYFRYDVLPHVDELKWRPINRSLTIALYDIFKDKEKVTDWLENNYKRNTYKYDYKIDPISDVGFGRGDNGNN